MTTAPVADDNDLRPPLDELARQLSDHHRKVRPRLRRLWDYYRNPATHASADAAQGNRWYRLAQEVGLPRRLTGAQREVVIENDIAWRVHTLVDFMFGKPVAVQSACNDPALAPLIEAFLGGALEAAGGSQLFQDMALLGAVYGHADLLLRVAPRAWRHADANPTTDPERLRDIAAGSFRVELIDPPDGVPLTHPTDYRRLEGYALLLPPIPRPARRHESPLHRLRERLFAAPADTAAPCELWTDAGRFLFDDARALSGDTSAPVPPALAEVNRLGRVPVVHVQNLPQPFFFAGLSEVEPLIPLQDELNTRLCDRANRVTLQSFKMYLGKGIEGFLERKVGPGQMWATDNPAASIETFGGDDASPGEEAHLREIREAMDKASAVSPVAAGLVRERVGNLTSASALRVTLMGLLARTQKKRMTYGSGIERLCELLLHAADVTGVLRTAPAQRRVRIEWPSPIPDDASQQLRDAQTKLALGIPRRRVLAELGYHADAAPETDALPTD